MNNIFISILSAVVLFTACKQKDSKANDFTKPVLTIAEPSASDTLFLSAEPEIHIEFTVTDNRALASLTVQLLDASGNVLYAASPDVKNLMVYPFHTHYVPSGITVETLMHVNIVVTDLAGNTENRVIDFIVAP